VGECDAASVPVDVVRKGFPMAPRQHAAGAPNGDTMVAHRAAVQRAVVAMSEHLEEDLSLNDLARVAFISPYHFNRIFRQVVGIPPCKFLGALRLQSAKRQLASSNLSVTEICFSVGYNSLGTFIRRFSSLVGLPPRRFRALSQSWQQVMPPPAGLLRALGRGQSPAASGSVHGQITAPSGFSSIILVGLFQSPIAQGAPIACAMLAEAGPFTLPPVADGTYYLLAVGLPRGADSRDSLLGDTLLRCDRSMRVEVRGGTATISPTLHLREPELIDPPILVSLPVLITNRWRAAAALQDALDHESHHEAEAAGVSADDRGDAPAVTIRL
jgi:AraC family transcriptional regulator